MLAETFTFSWTTSEMLTAIGLAFVALAGLMATGRVHINRRVDLKLEETVTDAVNRRMQIIDTKLDTISLNVRETNAAVGKVHDLEVTINNGLTAKVERIDSKVDELIDLHLWDGKERRRQ